MTAPRVAFTTLGCKVNQSETDLMARQFVAAGYVPVDFSDRADVYVVNTCTVTHVADRKSRQMLHQAGRANPDALVVATGCYASIVGNVLANERTLVVRNRDKDRLVELVAGHLSADAAHLPTFVDTAKYLSVSGGQERSRAQVKAQDGCDSHCTYCIIPRARGRSRSLLPGEVVNRVRALSTEGHSEIVITGVDLGSYGENDDIRLDLGGLLRRVLAETEVRRVRVSSLEPGDFKPEWLPLWADRRLCRHLHVPLQSGSAGVLGRMERRYSPQEYADMIALCRQAIPHVTITTDIMVGFPGETDEEFEETMAFVRGIAFDGMHVFKYSQRSGTRAARMEAQVREEVKSARAALLRTESAAGGRRLLARHEGMPGDVVWETERSGIWRGLTDTNVRVYGSPEECRPGTLTRVRLGGAFRDGLWGDPIREDIPLIAL